TGSGKTVIAAVATSRAVDRGERVLIVAPRRELIHQTAEKLAAGGGPHGIIMAGGDPDRVGTALPGQGASIDKVWARSNRARCEPFDLLIVDEGHLSITKRQVELLSYWGRRRLGLTATPTRKDGRALGVLFDTLIQPVTVSQLITDGYLVKPRYFSWATP